MIKTKEDLIGRYAVRADKEVFELFMQKCEGFGVEWRSGREPRNYDYGDCVACDVGAELGFFSNLANLENKGYKRLTISDFKQPKTRTEYKLVTMKDWEALKAFHDGQAFYLKPERAEDYELVLYTQALINSHQNNDLYTKEEVEIDWRDVAAECLGIERYRENEAGYYASNGQYLDLKGKYVGALFNDGETTIDQFLRMCHEVAEMTEKPE